MKVPFFSDEHINHKDQLLAEFSSVLDSKQLILGPKVKRFEAEFANYLNSAHCISVANGSDALEIALRAVGVGPGSRVATVANAGFYASTAIYQLGAIPVYIEIDPKTFLVSVNDLRLQIAKQPIDALVVTHLYGLPADIEEIMKIAKELNFSVIEDCAQAHGLKIGENFAGSFSDISTFSFYPTKNLGAIGDGGAVVTNNDQLANQVMKLRQYGWKDKYQVEVPHGRNSRLDELQAAVLLTKLPNLEKHNKLRKNASEMYFDLLKDLPVKFSTRLNLGVSHLLPILSKERDTLIKHLHENGIQAAIHYPIADHKQKAYNTEVSLLNTEIFCDQVISLPLYPGISQQSINYVVEQIKGFYAKR